MRKDLRAVGVGAYHGFIDFKDWDGLPDDLGVDDRLARAGYVVGATARVGCYLALGGYAASLL